MAFRYRIGDCGFGISGRWRPTGAVFRFCLRLSSASGEIVHNCERGTAGGMTFVSGLSGIPGMIRDCRDGGALRTQFLILPSALICTGKNFPHLCSSPSPVAGAPGDEFTFKPNFDLFDSTTPQSLRDSSPTWGAFTVCMPGIFDIYPMCLLAFSLICANEADD